MSCPSKDQMEIAENDERTTSSETSAVSATEAVAASSSTMRSTEPKKKLPIAVVASELMADHVSLRNAWVGTLREKRDISSAMRIVSNILPGMSHLKRCSGKRLIIAFAAPDESLRVPDRYYAVRQELENLFTTNGFDLSVFDKKFEIVRVPAGPQRTKAQASIATKIWPINFHPDPLIEEILNGSCFDTKDLDIIERCMGACIEAAAREAHGNQECNGSATIFDPIESKIIAVAASRIDRHPMWHAAMLVIDLVARLSDETAGAYELSVPENNSEETEDKSIVTVASCQTRKRKYSLNQRDPILGAYPTNLVDIISRYAPQSITTAAAAASVDPSRSSERAAAEGYLCTNYWIFLLREPCPLCAMALVHSRVSNVFYGIPNEYRGVLGSRALLHTTPGLNHRYRVWKGIREKECRQTFNEISLRMQTDPSTSSTSTS